jgi:8-oxo-dGTP pyrophosphatase MutT (NUDIX family)
MRETIRSRVAEHAPGDAAESWERVIAAAERAPGARTPGSLRHGAAHQPARTIDQPITPSAVLVPIVDRPEGETVLLTLRTDHLNDHAGQISFPGGRHDAGDSTPVETALREAEEEIGLTREQVEVVGRLDDYLVGTGYRITPVVGLVALPLSLALDHFEVAEAFEVPLAVVLSSARYQTGSRVINRIEHKFHVLPYKNYNIWGATAAILVNLRQVLAPSC